MPSLVNHQLDIWLVGRLRNSPPDPTKLDIPDRIRGTKVFILGAYARGRFKIEACRSASDD